MSINFIIQFIASGIFAFAFWRFFAGKYEGDRIERSLRLKVGEYRVHLHHWLWCGLAMIISGLVKFYSPTLLGLLAGSIVQGLSYKDRFVIIYKEADFKKIYAKYQ